MPIGEAVKTIFAGLTTASLWELSFKWVTHHNSVLSQVSQFQVLADPVKIPHTNLSSSIYWPRIQQCRNLC